MSKLMPTNKKFMLFLTGSWLIFFFAAPVLAVQVEEKPARRRPARTNILQQGQASRGKRLRQNAKQASFGRGKKAVEKRGVLRKKQLARQAKELQKLHKRKLLRQQKTAALHKRIRAKRASISARIQARHQAFKEQLLRIKDKRKRAILERLDRRYAQINERWTNHFLHVLDRLAQIVDKIAVRTETAADRGVDTGGAAEAIAAARSAIAAAQTTVADQAAKTYTLQIDTPANLRTNAQAVHQSLRQDLTAARSAVRAARQAVHNAFQALKAAITSSAPADNDAGTTNENANSQ